MFLNKKNQEVIAFIGGKLIALDTVNDSVFSERMMGDGFAIIPTTQEVFAPCDGVLSVVFPTGHAYGITQKNGREIILHLGIDTVELDGLGFSSSVKIGQTVKQGDLLGTMDIAMLCEKGVDTTSMMIFTSGETVTVLKENQDVKPKESGIIAVK